MADPRVHVDMELVAGTVVELPEQAYRHLVIVLRRIPGDAVTLFNGRGGEYAAKIDSIAKRNLMVRIEEFREVSRESPMPITLVQAVSKGERMDYTIQKAVELGVTAIQPVVTEHVVVRLDAERWARKQEHWQGVAIAAAEQSGRTMVPPVGPVLDLNDWMTKCPPDAFRLILSLTVKPTTMRRAPGQPIVLLVGPEGGWSEIERKLADLAGFAGLALGPRVLRTETAGVAALAVLQSQWGDMGASITQGT